jgi:glycosyltransferase involved in cell wall biosynthesis
VVVVDDGSDVKFHDEYRIIRERFAQARISWITLPENRGVSCAINTGLSYLLADPSIDWISYFQDDVDVHPELFEYLGRVQHRVERPLLTGRYSVEHPVVGEADINGIHVLSSLSVSGQHLHAHRDYWLGVMPLPSFKIGLPKPRNGSGCDWWIGSWSPNSVCKQGMHIICVPQLVSAFANTPEESTWGNTPFADDGLLPAKSTRTMISFCTTCSNRLYQFKQTFADTLKIILEDPDTEWVILNLNSKDALHEFMLEQIPALPPRVIYARAQSDHPWHVGVAKNVAHRLARGSILVNLDCDNYIGEMLQLSRAKFTPRIQAIHFWSGVLKDGTFGRIAIRRNAFLRLGGYDEAFHPMGYHDADLIERAKATGMSILHIPCSKGSAIWNDKQESMRYCNGSISDWETMNLENTAKSKLNLVNHQLVANEGKNWGQLDVEMFPGEGKTNV